MAQYEFMMIVDPSLSEEERTAKIADVKTILTEAGATISKEDVWGEKKLAYTINKSTKGYYVLYNIELDGTKIAEISKSINLNRSIWRYIFVK